MKKKIYKLKNHLIQIPNYEHLLSYFTHHNALWTTQVPRSPSLKKKIYKLKNHLIQIPNYKHFLSYFTHQNALWTTQVTHSPSWELGQYTNHLNPCYPPLHHFNLRPTPTAFSFFSLHVERKVTLYLLFQIHSLANFILSLLYLNILYLFFLYSSFPLKYYIFIHYLSFFRLAIDCLFILWRATIALPLWRDTVTLKVCEEIVGVWILWFGSPHMKKRTKPKAY